MIYFNNYSGVFQVENNLKESHEFKIGYRVDGKNKQATFDYKELPEDLITEFAIVTNKIARFAEEREGKD